MKRNTGQRNGAEMVGPPRQGSDRRLPFGADIKLSSKQKEWCPTKWRGQGGGRGRLPGRGTNCAKVSVTVKLGGTSELTLAKEYAYLMWGNNFPLLLLSSETQRKNANP